MPRVRHTRAVLALAVAYPLPFQARRCRTFNLQGVSCRPSFECGMTFPSLGLTPESWMGSRVQSTVSCFRKCFIQFSMPQVLVRLQKQFISNLVYPTWACAAGFNNNNNIFSGIHDPSIVNDICIYRVS